MDLFETDNTTVIVTDPETYAQVIAILKQCGITAAEGE